MPSRRARHRIEPLSEIADRHRLYELAVQDAGAEVAFVDRTFRRLRRRPAETLREDFCGTAAVCGRVGPDEAQPPCVGRRPERRGAGLGPSQQPLAPHARAGPRA